MKLTVFQSDKGDCMLLEGGDGRRVLVDGGMRESYSEHVAPALGKLRAKGAAIDVVYVSHIDQDHISGVLQMMDDEVDWRVHDYQVKHGNPKHKKPGAPRPPKVKHIWHNAFHEQLKRNAGEVGDMLAASAAILSGSDVGEVRGLASSQADLVTSIAEAIQLSRRVSPDQLGIKLNHPAGGRLMMVRDPPGAPVKLGGMRLHVIGPFEEDLAELRKQWNEWLRDNKERLKKIQATADDEAGTFSVREIDDLLLPKLGQAKELEALLPLDSKPVKKLGARKKVTVPNLASLMFLVEERGKTLLLTGDGHHKDILKGLAHVGKLDAAGGIHVNVLKVQHHGSEHNLDLPFCQKVTADHYVFCGNGEHENPDLDVIQAIADSRIGKPNQLSSNAQAGNPFKFWFNSSRAVTPKKEAKAHMTKVTNLVNKLAAKSGGRLKSHFIEAGPSFVIKV
ncbi:MAG TPA: MBL fold metallo-hydrolase [Pyrinomonadaceae bacterium]|nr:MBL fold metallo-hydrolase [Pyrinomonadaceae bacterium]